MVSESYRQVCVQGFFLHFSVLFWFFHQEKVYSYDCPITGV